MPPGLIIDSIKARGLRAGPLQCLNQGDLLPAIVLSGKRIPLKAVI